MDNQMEMVHAFRAETRGQYGSPYPEDIEEVHTEQPNDYNRSRLLPRQEERMDNTGDLVNQDEYGRDFASIAHQNQKFTNSTVIQDQDSQEMDTSQWSTMSEFARKNPASDKKIFVIGDSHLNEERHYCALKQGYR